MEKPKIRFKGYQEDWEQRKLGEVFKEYSEKNHTELPALTIIQGGGTVKREESDRNLMYDESNLSNYKMVRKDDFIVHLRSFEGGLEKSLLDGIISPAYHTFHSDVADSRFYYPYFRSHEFIKHKLVPHVYGIRDGRSIDIAGMKTIEIPYTSIEEQRKIGDYLESLDHLITLHQRKCEEMKTLKKYMLQKMFPQNGQSVPQIRFSGFTEDWEQRKLGDVFEQTSNLVNPKEDEIELWSLTVEDGLTKKSDRYNREFLVKKDDNFKEVRPGDIVYNPMNMTLGAVGYNGMAKSVAVSGYYTTMVAKENYDTYYINTWLKSPQAIRLYRTYATGSLIEKQRVQFPTLSIIPVTFPKYEEQIKIGSYFHSLDNLITLHQQKCDELRNIKKFMLQNMFI